MGSTSLADRFPTSHTAPPSLPPPRPLLPRRAAAPSRPPLCSGRLQPPDPPCYGRPWPLQNKDRLISVETKPTRVADHNYGSNRSPDPPIWDFLGLRNMGGLVAAFWGTEGPKRQHVNPPILRKPGKSQIGGSGDRFEPYRWSAIRVGIASADRRSAHQRVKALPVPVHLGRPGL